MPEGPRSQGDKANGLLAKKITLRVEYFFAPPRENGIMKTVAVLPLRSGGPSYTSKQARKTAMNLRDSKRAVGNERKTLLKVKAGRMMGRLFSPAKILSCGLMILTFFLIGILLRYLAGSHEITAPPEQETAPLLEQQDTRTETLAYTFREGDTFYEVLLALNVPPQEIFQVLESSRAVYDLKRITPGSTVNLTIDPLNHTVSRLDYSFDDRHVLVVSKTDTGYSSSQEDILYDTALRTVSGTIKSNLFDDAIKAGCNPQLILNLADIFAWDVDFSTSLRENDSFKLLFEEIHKDGEFIRQGKILAAEFVNRGKLFRAFRFEDSQGNSGYYDGRGRSLAREFLKSPLRYSRISSTFTNRRFHPVLKIYRPHLGVDYAAPTGTPVEATAKGTIIFCGWRGAYGKCIIVKHNHLYTSFYGHLSRFAPGMKKGKSVKQGQVIGYVGTTGLSTGPHLDYRLQQNGKFVNPLTFKSPQQHAVTGDLQPAFQKRKRELLLRLEQIDEGLLLARTSPPFEVFTAGPGAASSP